MLIGVISDTHGFIRPAALAALAGTELIIHAGDVGEAAVLEALAAIAPVVAVRGNCDVGPWGRELPGRKTVRVEGVTILVTHDRSELHTAPPEEGTGVVITGHSHKPFIERQGGVLYLNPGSAGRRRFRLPVSVARLRVESGHADADIVVLE